LIFIGELFLILLLLLDVSGGGGEDHSLARLRRCWEVFNVGSIAICGTLLERRDNATKGVKLGVEGLAILAFDLIVR
jgi:hypothetical protein